MLQDFSDLLPCRQAGLEWKPLNEVAIKTTFRSQLRYIAGTAAANARHAAISGITAASCWATVAHKLDCSVLTFLLRKREFRFAC